MWSTVALEFLSVKVSTLVSELTDHFVSVDPVYADAGTNRHGYGG
jgi:hypothetical protein